MGWSDFGKGLLDVATGGISYIARKNKKSTNKKINAVEDKGKVMQREGEASFDKGIDKGQKLYDSVVNEDALSNLMDQRSGEKKEIAERRRDLSRGMDARENAAGRAAFEAQIKRAASGARKQTAASIANSGMQGGVANAQTRATESDIAQQRIQASREQMLGNIAMKQEGLKKYEATINDQEGEARNNLLNRLQTGLAGGQQNAQMYAAIQNMIESQKTDVKNSRDGLLGGKIIPGFL